MPITFPFGDMKASFPSALKFRLYAFGLKGDTALAISTPVLGFTRCQKSLRSEPT